MTDKKSNNNFKKFFNNFKNLNFKDKRIIVLTLTSILVLLILVSTSFAMFFSRNESDNKDLYESGDLVVTFDDSMGNAISINPARPVSDEYANTLEPYTFTIKNTGTFAATYSIKLTDEVITNVSGLTNAEVKSNIKYQINDGTPGLLSDISDNILLTGTLNPGATKTVSLRLWIKKDATNEIESATYSAKIAVSGKALVTAALYTDPSGANSPELAEGMIPVIYDETCESETAADGASGCWEVADTSTAWYSYNDQKWANAVTTSVESYRTAEAGTEIPMDDINSMWVWIPRYRYKIASNLGISTTTPPQIDVIFESGTETNGVTEKVYRTGIADDGTNTNYYTHPAFRNVDNIEYDSSTTSRGAWDEEITGFWAAKFETGTSTSPCYGFASEENCLDVEPIIKPDVQSLRYQTVSTQFITSIKFAGGTFDSETGNVTFTANENNPYGLNATGNTTDTHMMKNTEWGAVAILSQCEYGKMGNEMYTGIYKEIYQNIHNYSGYSKGSPGIAYDGTGINCGYNDIKDRGDGTGACGAGASTTGTIYGIYDMSGGNYEYVMGNYIMWTKESGFTAFPSSKYYDLYQGTSSTDVTKDKAILGDSSWETKYWYSDATYSAGNNNYPWSHRGGNNENSTDSLYVGIFAQGSSNGTYASNFTFRNVLIP